jgi:L-seryl-tRNA(Ser) seleniumtransferase
VINGTGVLLHTNMGRAPLGRELFEEVAEAVGGYSNLEMNVLERKRGIRGPHVSALLAQACGAEDAVVVNNNAAALFLILREFAAGKEVVISRGELVQIGGGFRIPDILSSSGAVLREVGTTNITSLEDFDRARGPNTGLLLKVHHSNFRMDGFVETPGLRELAALRTQELPLVSDLGTGNLVRSTASGPVREPTPADAIRDGADLVCFSCDKLLGGVQGGVIAGRRELVSRLRRNPVMRVIRVDKIVYAALQVVLRHHLAGEHSRVTLWRMGGATAKEVGQRAAAFLEREGLPADRFEVVESVATFGGGSTPGEEIRSAAIRLRADRSPDAVAGWFQREEPPVVGTVREGAFQIDFRTVLPEDEAPLAAALRRFSQGAS